MVHGHPVHLCIHLFIYSLIYPFIDLSLYLLLIHVLLFSHSLECTSHFLQHMVYRVRRQVVGGGTVLDAFTLGVSTYACYAVHGTSVPSAVTSLAEYSMSSLR